MAERFPARGKLQAVVLPCDGRGERMTGTFVAVVAA